MQIENFEHIILDDLQTWSIEIINILKNKGSEIKKYYELEFIIDKAAEEDPFLRVKRPNNKYEKSWSDAVLELKKILTGKNILGFHCSRLTETEILEVCQNGLIPLSLKFSIERIKKIRKQNLINDYTATQLIKNNKCAAKYRVGNVFFFHCLSTLKDESGLFRLFNAWGGEAIYSEHERNPEIITTLSSIGTPCIVIGSLTTEEICNNDLAERMIKIWLNKNENNGIAYDCDTFTKRRVEVLKIIKQKDSLFENLTNYSKWG